MQLGLLIRAYWDPELKAVTLSEKGAITDLHHRKMVTMLAAAYNNIELTERGRAYVEALLRVPFPIARTTWVTPQADN